MSALAAARKDSLTLPGGEPALKETDVRQGDQSLGRARAGDPTAFEQLLARHERMVLGTALRLLGRMDAAQDAAQETFLRLHKNLVRLDHTQDLGPWLYRVVVNVCRDVARRFPRERHVALGDLAEGALEAARGSSDAILDALAKADQRRLVQAALRTLPEKERAAIVLRDMEGLATSEVALILGSTEGTVRSQVSAARLKIKKFVMRGGWR